MINRTRAVLVSALAAGGVITTPASAAVELFSLAGAAAAQPQTSILRDEEQGTTSAFAQADLDFSGAEAHANTSFGSNKARASGIVTQVAQANEGVSHFGEGVAVSRWRDVMTISNPTAARGGSFQATVVIHLSGTMFVSDGRFGTVFTTLEFAFDPDDQTSFGEQGVQARFGFGQGNPVSGTQTINQSLSLTFDFGNGDPFDFEAELQLNASVSTRVPEGAGLARGDFFSTAVVSQVILPDGFSLSSQSGTIYPVPTPGAAVFLAIAGALGAKRPRTNPRR